MTGSMDWLNYINFRDYLNRTPSVAKAYEDLKMSLAEQAPIDCGREKYLKGKHDFIVYTLRKALVKSYLGKTVSIPIDRPIGSVHPKHQDIVYPINYGYIPNVFGGDGEELDVYLLGIDVLVTEYIGRIIGIVHRHNDVEDKLVMAPEGFIFKYIFRNSTIKPKLKRCFKSPVVLLFSEKMVDYLKKALIYGHTSRISS